MIFLLFHIKIKFKVFFNGFDEIEKVFKISENKKKEEEKKIEIFKPNNIKNFKKGLKNLDDYEKSEEEFNILISAVHDYEKNNEILEFSSKILFTTISEIEKEINNDSNFLSNNDISFLCDLENDYFFKKNFLNEKKKLEKPSLKINSQFIFKKKVFYLYLSLFILIYPYLSLFIFIYLYLSLFIFIYLYLSLFIFIYLYLSLFIFIYLYLSLFIFIYLYLSLFIFIYLYLSLFIFIYLYLSLFIFIYLYLSLFIFIYLYLSLFIFIYLYLSLFIFIYLYLSLFIFIYLYLSLFIFIYLYLSLFIEGF